MSTQPNSNKRSRPLLIAYNWDTLYHAVAISMNLPVQLQQDVDVNPKLQQRFKLSLAEIAEFCQRWQIVEMALFGSVLREEFRADSDIDILISFAPNARQGLLTLARIKHELETRLERPVDIVLKQSVETSENWIRRREILQTAQVIYEQR